MRCGVEEARGTGDGLCHAREEVQRGQGYEGPGSAWPQGAQVKVRWPRRPSRWWVPVRGEETEQEAHEWVEAPWEEVRPSGKGTLRLDWEVQGECGA